MNLLGNIIWLLFGGLLISLEYFLAGILSCITIVGIPFGLQLFKLGILSLLPFGKQVKYSEQAPGCINALLNIIWIFTGGILICLEHLLFGIILSITIVGIPFGLQHFKMMTLAFTPFGKRVD